MPHDRYLQETILAELRHSCSALSKCIVVTAVAGDVVLAGHVDSFTEKHTAASLVASVAGVRNVTDQMEVRPKLDRDCRMLIDSRRARSDARVDNDASPCGISAGTMTFTTDNGLLTVTGEIDWRQRIHPTRTGTSAPTGGYAASNISDDILQMLPSCFFPTAPASR